MSTFISHTFSYKEMSNSTSTLSSSSSSNSNSTTVTLMCQDGPLYHNAKFCSCSDCEKHRIVCSNCWNGVTKPCYTGCLDIQTCNCYKCYEHKQWCHKHYPEYNSNGGNTMPSNAPKLFDTKNDSWRASMIARRILTSSTISSILTSDSERNIYDDDLVDGTDNLDEKKSSDYCTVHSELDSSFISSASRLATTSRSNNSSSINSNSSSNNSNSNSNSLTRGQFCVTFNQRRSIPDVRLKQLLIVL